ncbi:MAG: hypothetical protein ACREL7_07995 [Longimicrobiales bacterium]
MYSTCLFCSAALGANESVEAFPIGRRVAFDGERGRLWVVCRKCERWNLSPLEERWEAIEECQRAFTDTRTRVSTEEIGLARLPDGLELVRIGKPLRPEFAAWRYGDQFGRRRRRAFLVGGAIAVVAGGIVIGGTATGLISAGVLSQTGNFVNLFVNARTRLRVRTADGDVLKLKNPDLAHTRILPAQGGGYTVKIGSKNPRLFEGAEAERLAGLIVPKMNSTGGTRDVVQQAVGQIESEGGPDAFLKAAIGAGAGSRYAPAIRRRRTRKYEPGAVARLAKPTRLAVEMALHEEQERRALEGELQLLEAAWREAEEVAKIADNLLVPADADTFIRKHRPDE